MHIADSYLCSEIEAIDRMLQAIPISQIVCAEIQGPYLRPFKPVIHLKPSPHNKPCHRREVITKTIDTLRILQNDPSCGLSLQQGAWNLVNLSVGLYHLELYPEAAVIGLWAVHLFRVLEASDQNAYRPYLILSLHNLSRYHIAKEDNNEAWVAMSECLQITRILVRESPTPEIIGFLSRSLTESSRIAIANQEYTRSLKESQEAVTVSEDVLFNLWRSKHTSLTFSDLEALCFFGRCLNRRAEYGMQDPGNSNLKTSFADDEIESMILQRMQDYARALHQLSYSLHHHKRFVEAIDADKKALQVVRFISQKRDNPLDTDIAEVLLHLGHRDFRLFLHPSEAIHYIQECIEVYQRFSIDGSILYRKLLYHALYTQATILRTVEDYTEEVKVWGEAAKIARSIQEDLLCANALYQACWGLRRLDRLDEAVNIRMEAITTYRPVLEAPSPIVANAHYDLAVDLQLAHRHEEARVAAQEAISQYRALTLQNTELSTEALADSVTLLASILLCTHEVDEALDTGEEALRLFRFIVSQNPPDNDTTSKYEHCLDINMAACFKSDDETKAIKRSFFVVELFEELLTLCPEKYSCDLIDFWESHGLLLNRYDRLEEARKWIDKAVDWFGTRTIKVSYEIERFIVCLCNRAMILDDQGFREKALDSILKAIDLSKDVAKLDYSLASVYVASRVRQVDLLWELGRYNEALSVSEDIIVFARRTRLPDMKDFIDCLLIHATTLNYNDQPERSIDIANDAIELCRSNNSSLEQENRDRKLQLSHALQTLSESLADLGRHGESLAYAKKSLDQILQLQSGLSPSRWPHLRYSRTLLSINLAHRLATVGNYEGALELLSDARTFFEEFSPSRNGYYIELARVLRLISLLHCSFERHEEGATVANSLASLRKRLFIVFPGLASLIDKEFERKMRRLSWLKSTDMTLHCPCLCTCGQNALGSLPSSARCLNQ